MKRIALAVAFVFSVAAIAAGSAGTATSKSAFQVFVNETASAANRGDTQVHVHQRAVSRLDASLPGHGLLLLAQGG